MCPVGGRFPGEEGWGEFKAIPLERLRETSPLVTILIHVALAALGGVAGVFFMVFVGMRIGLWSIYRLLGIRFPTVSQEALAILALGFIGGAFLTILVAVQTRRQFREFGRKYGRRSQGRKPGND